MRASNEASTSTELASTLFRGRPEVALDLIAAVKGLHELSPQQLGKLIRDSGNNVVRHIVEDGSCIQVDLEKLARNLPLHLIAVIMAWERDKSTFKYLLYGILLLHSMCDLASRVPKIEQILLDDVKISEQLIDLVFYLLVLLGAYRQESHAIPSDMVLLHSALVACSLKLLTVIVSPQYQEVAQALTAYYKVDIFTEAAYAAVCVDVKFLQIKLSAQQDDSSGSASPTAEETLNHLCQQCNSSLQFVQSLCQQKLFRECVVKNKELCGNGGVLILVQAVMNLKLSGSENISSYMAAISRLKSKALSILLHLCEAESVSYLDEVASNTATQDMAKSVGLEVLALLKKMFGIDLRQLNAPSEASYPKGQLELNAMRLADVFSDDSNFRSFIMINFDEKHAVVRSSPLHREMSSGHGNNVVNMGEGTLDFGFQEVVQFDANRRGEQFFDRKNSGMMEQEKSNGPSINSRENEKDGPAFDSSGSDSSPTRGKTHIDRMDVDHIKGSSFDETAEEEKTDPLHSEEKQQRKRKRTIMNDKQIALIESALIDDPDMHCNATALRLLNNRKAKLARAAKDIRVSYDGDTADRLGGSGHLGSPRSSMDDARVSFSASGSNGDEVTDVAVSANADEDVGTSHAAPRDIATPSPSFEPGQYVMLVDERREEVGKGAVFQVGGHWCGNDLDQSGTCVVDIKNLSVDIFSNVLHPSGEHVMLVGDKAEEIGMGKVFQVRGKWCGEDLEQSGMCVVDITELSIEAFADLPHPVEATGNKFYEAGKRLGVMRVLWDSDKLLRLPPR
ncbi:hypothetical protein SASPL_122757 [Salvia splendens]|uniref:Uncharacterized protein n=1 Tax=Salvia splendens TaxID=180675 RepID=A0A8X8ZSS0_SALSN|nr:hypothetical protein SASPL_122757 [Salvia splendens]